MKTVRRLYQMTFLQECLAGEGVLGTALNWIVDNMIRLCNVLWLWCRFGKVIAKLRNSAPSIQQVCRASSCPENCCVFFSVIYFSGNNRKSLFRRVTPRKAEQTVTLQEGTELFVPSEKAQHHQCVQLVTTTYIYWIKKVVSNKLQITHTFIS